MEIWMSNYLYGEKDEDKLTYLKHDESQGIDLQSITYVWVA